MTPSSGDYFVGNSDKWIEPSSIRMSYRYFRISATETSCWAHAVLVLAAVRKSFLSDELLLASVYRGSYSTGSSLDNTMGNPRNDICSDNRYELSCTLHTLKAFGSWINEDIYLAGPRSMLNRYL